MTFHRLRAEMHIARTQQNLQHARLVRTDRNCNWPDTVVKEQRLLWSLGWSGWSPCDRVYHTVDSRNTRFRYLRFRISTVSYQYGIAYPLRMTRVKGQGIFPILRGFDIHGEFSETQSRRITTITCILFLGTLSVQLDLGYTKKQPVEWRNVSRNIGKASIRFLNRSFQIYAGICH